MVTGMYTDTRQKPRKTRGDGYNNPVTSGGGLSGGGLAVSQSDGKK